VAPLVKTFGLQLPEPQSRPILRRGSGRRGGNPTNTSSLTDLGPDGQQTLPVNNVLRNEIQVAAELPMPRTWTSPPFLPLRSRLWGRRLSGEDGLGDHEKLLRAPVLWYSRNREVGSRMDSRAVRSAVFAAVSLALGYPARAGTESQTRAVIRGTGKDVTIVYRSGTKAAPLARASAEENPLGEAVQMKSRGASDESVISYLLLHRADIPPVVAAEAVRQLRKAGAGQPVIAFLSTLGAVDIGETGEGSEIVAAPMTRIGPGYAADMDWAAAGYPMGGYYGTGGHFGPGGLFGSGGRFGRGGHFGSHGHPFFFFHASKLFGRFFPLRRPMLVHQGHMPTRAAVNAAPSRMRAR
jgi:hypothetical protein